MAKKIVDIADLKPDVRNANKGTQRGRGMVEASLREVGAGRSIVTDKDGRVIAGNKTLEAAADIGLKIRVVETTGQELVVVQRNDLDLSDDTGPARKLAYYDNRAGETGLAWDAEVLLADLNNGVDLSGMFNADELDVLLDGLIEKEPMQPAEAQTDKAAELQKLWGTSLGQIWQLGKHRLACGDCTDKATVERLMIGERAKFTFSDPPYGKNYQSNMRQKTQKFEVLQNDESIDSLFVDNINLFTDGWVIVCTSWDFCFEWRNSLMSLGEMQNMIIWDKGGGYLGDLEHSLGTDYEIMFAFNRGAKIKGKRIGSVWRINKDLPSDYLHATQKPVELPAQAIECFSSKNDIVYDPFAGSAPVLIACEQLNRQCRAVEISEAYCAVILQRWSDSTGQTPVLINSFTVDKQ
jgi:DNA modification methylase